MPVHTCVAECAWNIEYICHWGILFIYIYFLGYTFGGVYIPCTYSHARWSYIRRLTSFFVVSLVCQALLFPFLCGFFEQRPRFKQLKSFKSFLEVYWYQWWAVHLFYSKTNATAGECHCSSLYKGNNYVFQPRHCLALYNHLHSYSN